MCIGFSYVVIPFFVFWAKVCGSELNSPAFSSFSIEWVFKDWPYPCQSDPLNVTSAPNCLRTGFAMKLIFCCPSRSEAKNLEFSRSLYPPKWDIYACDLPCISTAESSYSVFPPLVPMVWSTVFFICGDSRFFDACHRSLLLLLRSPNWLSFD